ncbi:MAG TPA: PAS domain S-box protein, partial [Bacteroidia bacterium]|nr:PAS domain S-box protein [Bacteroidia bacterium]
MNLSLIHNLHFDHWGLIAAGLLPLLINVSIIIYVSFTLPPSRTHTSFLVFVFSVAIWQLSDTMLRMSSNALTATYWTRIDNISMLFVAPFAILFGLRFALWHKRVSPALLLSLLFAIPMMLSAGIIAGLDHYEIHDSETWSWIVNPRSDLFTLSIYCWHSFIGLCTITLYWSIYILKRKNETARRPAILLAWGVSIPTLAAIVFEVIGPLVFHVDDIPITASLLTLFSILAFIAIKHYQLLDYSPRHQWDKIINLTNEGILIVNLKDEIMYANECMCKTLGYSGSELNGKKASMLLTGASNWMNPKNELLDLTDILTGRSEMLISTRSGEKIWMLLSGSPYLDVHDKVTGFIGLFTNINDLKKTKAVLKAKVEELNTFFYRASHDLKSPAASIQGLVSLLAIGDESDRAFICSSIESSALKLLETTDRLSQIAAISQRQIQVDVIDWENKIKSIEAEVCSLATDCCCEKEISVKEISYSDPYLIRMILRIAFQNAVKYRDLNKKECLIRFGICEEKQGIRIELSDNGSGIPKQVQEKIFTMFCKGSNKSGVGLGLYTLKAAVDKLG